MSASPHGVSINEPYLRDLLAPSAIACCVVAS